ncbi:hypothetical protein VKT23_004891 [Stygiomarasmius scandens]|uniref:F-box domain-containing protein n=1 Tax=Marasmiellus scandens TaxID=2682957 RepID=A0ABR1JUU3_9AGAR
MNPKLSLLDFPNELLLEVAQYLHGSSLLCLAMICKRLHCITVPYIFHILGFKDPTLFREHTFYSEPQNLRLSDDNILLLPATNLYNIGSSPELRMNNFSRIEVLFSAGSSLAFRETHSLLSLTSQLSNLGYVKFNISSVRFRDSVRAVEWAVEFARLVNGLLGMADTTVELVGVNKILMRMFQAHERRKQREEDMLREEQRRRDAETSKTKKRIPRLLAFRKSIFPTLRKLDRDRPTSPEVGLVSTPDYDSEIVDDCLPSPAGVRALALKIHSPLILQYPFAAWTSQCLSTVSSVSLSNLGPLTAKFLDESHLPCLRTFHLDVEDLEIPSIPAPSKILGFLARHPSITTLDLSRLSENPTSFAPRPVVSSLDSVEPPKSLGNLLPQMTTLIATPEYMMYFFAEAKEDGNDSVHQPSVPFPKLASITVTSDYYGMPPYGYQYMRFEKVLRLIDEWMVTNTSKIGQAHEHSTRNLTLEIRFLCRLGLVEWLDSSFAGSASAVPPVRQGGIHPLSVSDSDSTAEFATQSNSTAVLASSYPFRLTTLSLNTSGRFYFSSSILSALTSWISRVPLFAGVEGIIFSEQCSFDTEMGSIAGAQPLHLIREDSTKNDQRTVPMSKGRILSTLRESCPWAKRVVFGPEPGNGTDEMPETIAVY